MYRDFTFVILNADYEPDSSEKDCCIIPAVDWMSPPPAGSSPELPDSQEDLSTVKVCVSPAHSIGVGQRVQICKQVEPRRQVRGAASWSPWRTIKATINVDQRGSAFGPSPAQLVSPVVAALPGF